MPLSSGARLGPYEILAAIGAGDRGEVYRARDTQVKRDVALKVLPPRWPPTPNTWRGCSAMRNCWPRSTTRTSHRFMASLKPVARARCRWNSSKARRWRCDWQGAEGSLL